MASMEQTSWSSQVAAAVQAALESQLVALVVAVAEEGVGLAAVEVAATMAQVEAVAPHLQVAPAASSDLQAGAMAPMVLLVLVEWVERPLPITRVPRKRV
jgi:hypothetical protein